MATYRDNRQAGILLNRGSDGYVAHRRAVFDLDKNFSNGDDLVSESLKIPGGSLLRNIIVMQDVIASDFSYKVQINTEVGVTVSGWRDIGGTIVSNSSGAAVVSFLELSDDFLNTYEQHRNIRIMMVLGKNLSATPKKLVVFADFINL